MDSVLYSHGIDNTINCLEVNEMSIERKNEIEALVKEYGLSFASAMTVSEYEKKRQAKEMEDFYNFITSKEWKEWPISTDSES